MKFQSNAVGVVMRLPNKTVPEGRENSVPGWGRPCRAIKDQAILVSAVCCCCYCISSFTAKPQENKK